MQYKCIQYIRKDNLLLLKDLLKKQKNLKKKNLEIHDFNFEKPLY